MVSAQPITLLMKQPCMQTTSHLCQAVFQGFTVAESNTVDVGSPHFGDRCTVQHELTQHGTLCNCTVLPLYRLAGAGRPALQRAAAWPADCSRQYCLPSRWCAQDTGVARGEGHAVPCCAVPGDRGWCAVQCYEGTPSALPFRPVKLLLLRTLAWISTIWCLLLGPAGLHTKHTKGSQFALPALPVPFVAHLTLLALPANQQQIYTS